VSTEKTVVSGAEPPAGLGAGAGAAYCIVKRADGVYADPMVLGPAVSAAIDTIFSSDTYLRGLDYAVLVKLIYNVGPDLPRARPGDTMVRLADDIVSFDPARRKLYKAVKMTDGQAEYYFEPVVMTDPNDPDGYGIPARLDVDEFIADMWSKHIRFGIDVAAVRAAIASGKSERFNIAHRLAAVPGIDAHVIEVSSDLHRSDAPRQLANGKLDLMAFQNRFPQIKKGVRLLKKVPRQDGKTGFEMTGIAIEPPIPKDLDLGAMAGPGTVVDASAEGDFLITLQAGFLSVDPQSHQISVGDKIVSRDGVSARTTGNLQLAGDYEEFGEVQEKRTIEGEGITIHADVFGHIVSRGGNIVLNSNLVNGSANNVRGDIAVQGVASGSILQTSLGTVTLNRAESCIISGTRVVIDLATNCEIMADEVVIRQAEGCAIAARKIRIELAGPRRQSEMTLFAMQPDSAKLDEAIVLVQAKHETFGQMVERRKAEMEALTNEPEVRKYVLLASKVRKNELSLTAEQLPQFHKMAAAVGPALKAISKVALQVKACEVEQQAAGTLLEQLVAQRSECAGMTEVAVAALNGDTQLRVMKFNPDDSTLYDLPSKDIKVRLRANTEGSEPVLSASSGQIAWRAT
jgi:hypothetical protein